MKKYEFTGETMEYEGKILQRIRYIAPVRGVSIQKGDLGGWIEGEHNLSHDGDSSVLEEAKVFDNARVEDNAVASGCAIVKDSAVIKGLSHVFSESIIGADTVVSGKTWICGRSEIFFFSTIYKQQKINFPNIFGNSQIYNTEIQATGEIFDSNIHNEKLEGHLNLVNKDMTE